MCLAGSDQAILYERSASALDPRGTLAHRGVVVWLRFGESPEVGFVLGKVDMAPWIVGRCWLGTANRGPTSRSKILVG